MKVGKLISIMVLIAARFCFSAVAAPTIDVQKESIRIENASSAYTLNINNGLRLEQVTNKLINANCLRDYSRPRTYSGWVIPEQY